MGFNFFNVRDTLVNFVTGLGTWKDPTQAATRTLRPLNRDYLENAYRDDWVSRAIVDMPAEDATRAWRSWTGKRKQIDAIHSLEKKLLLQLKTKQAMIRGRLYGGAGIVLGIDDGMEPYEPINWDKCKPGCLKFIVVMNRYELMAGPRIYNVQSEWYTRPEYFTVATPLFGWYGESGTVGPGYGSSPSPAEMTRRSAGQVLPPTGGDLNRQVTPISGMVRIHPSRVIEFVGNELPDWRLQPMGGGWGDSVLQTVDEAVRDYGLTVGGIANMVNDAKMDVIKLPDFTERISSSEYTNRLLSRFSLVNQSKSQLNSILLDKDEEWTRVQSSFAGLPQVLHEFLTVVAAAGRIAPSRLFGQAVGHGGLNSGAAGASDLRNYYDDIASKQETDYAVRMTNLDRAIRISATGDDDENKIAMEWLPLWELEPQEKAAINKIKAEATQVDVTTGLINEDVLRAGRISQLREDNIYPGLEDALAQYGDEPVGITSRMWSPGVDPNTGEQIQPAGGGNGFGDPSDDGDDDQPGEADLADATSPRSLYARRDVLNGKEILAHFKKQGIDGLMAPDQLHVTIAYSRDPVDWIKCGASDGYGEDEDGNVIVKPGGPRVMEQFGDALVLCFASNALSYRHANIKNAGASWDWDDYSPHVSVSWHPQADQSLAQLEPWRGEIMLGPEIFEEIDDNWREKVS